jgi:hypothetical protein
LTNSILQKSGIDNTKQHSKEKVDELNNKAIGKWWINSLAFKTAAKTINQTNSDITKTNFKLKNSLNSIINFDKNQTRDFPGGVEDMLNPTPDDKRRSIQKFFRQPSSGQKDGKELTRKDTIQKSSSSKDIKALVLQKVSQIAKLNAEKEKLKEEIKGLLRENKKQGTSIEYNNGEEINLESYGVSKSLNDDDLILIKIADLSKLKQYNTGAIISLESGSIVEVSEGRSNITFNYLERLNSDYFSSMSTTMPDTKYNITDSTIKNNLTALRNRTKDTIQKYVELVSKNRK